MHDPSTLAFSIKYPWKNRGYRNDFISIWHVDPERDGTDDSCGWFMRQRHGDKKVLEKIVRDFDSDWDRTWSPSKDDHDPEDGEFVQQTYYRGLFKPNGDPRLSPIAITLNLFLVAAMEHFGSRRKAYRFISRHLAEILIFAENPTDSLIDAIKLEFEKGCGEEYSNKKRDDRLREMAGIIYAYVLRSSRPWWKHPQWHVHHWRIQVHPWQQLRRWLFERCAVCGRGFRWNESPLTDWNHTRLWHDRCDSNRTPIKEV